MQEYIKEALQQGFITYPLPLVPAALEELI